MLSVLGMKPFHLRHPTHALPYSKSSLAVARAALQVAQESQLEEYSHAFSPHQFTQAQLLAVLVLKAHLGKDYRGITTLLAEWSDAREALGLKKVPHFSTLWVAQKRLLKKSPAICSKLKPWLEPASKRN